MSNWQLLELPKLDKIYSITNELNKVVLATTTALYNIEENNTLTKIIDIKLPFGCTYKVANTKTYIGTDNEIHIADIGTQSFRKLIKYVTSEHIITDSDNVLYLTDNVIGALLTPDNSRTRFDFSSTFPNWNNNFFNGSALKGDNLYFLNSWGANKLKATATNVVWQLNIKTGEAIDITENLNCLNMLGQPYGIVKSLITNEEKTKLYISTETGVYERYIGGYGWKCIRFGWGNHQLFWVDNVLIAIKNNLDKVSHSVAYYKDNEWYELDTLVLPKETEVKSVAKRDNQLYLSFNIYQAIATIDISNYKVDTLNKPTVAKYINLSNPSTAKVLNDKLYIAANNSIVSLENNTANKLVDTSYKVFDIDNVGNVLLIACSNKLQAVIDNTLVTILESNEVVSNLSYFKVATSDKLIANLNNKTLNVLSPQLELITSYKLDGDVITDIAVADNQIFVVGFNNRRNNNPVQIAFCHIYTLIDGELIHNKATDDIWYYDAKLVSNDMADARLYCAEVYGDKLYVLGETAGGNSIFRWNGRDLATPTFKHYDAYNYPGVGKVRDAHFSYYAVIDIATRTVERGQFAIPRLQKSLVSNTNRAKTIWTNGDDIYIGTSSAYGVPGRDLLKFNGDCIPEYRGSDASLLRVNNELTQRSWVTPGSGEVLLLTDKYAVIATDNTGDLSTTEGTIDKSMERNTYIVVW